MTQPDRGIAVSAAPTGTVTFLFSDVEGSTTRWERNRAAMSDALARHDALMRAAVEAHGGFVFKTVGDEFCCAFASAPNALAAALDAQRALTAADFSAVGGMRVRMALHAGVADERDGDYFGPAVNRVARLLAIGHGAQVLVSDAVAALLRGQLPPQVTLRDLGSHRLKDLSSERVHQLVAPDLPDDFAPLLSVDALPNNLPHQLTSFVGREAEVSDIKALLQSARLVSLVGAGGAGKTRCALQSGAELLDAYVDGVWFVELASLSDPSLIASTVALALQVQSLPNKPVFDMLLHYLKHKRLLLILDNCEHLIADVRTTAAAILRDCPEVHVLATSRERLNVPGEFVFRMPSLEVPPQDAAITPETIARNGATALFSARASAADSRFAITGDNAPIVAEICRRLDGLPLAVELAAARIKVLSPAQLIQKLDDRFRVLTGGAPTVLPRQQTMRALIDWSYDLLSENERELLRRLSVFAGGFTLETALPVCGGDSPDEIALLDSIASLVDKSLVQVDPGAEVTRYRLLESTRQYARERLVKAGEYDDAARAHAVAFLALAETFDDVNSAPDREWFARAGSELDNWRTALAWALGARKDVQLGQRLVCAMRRTWTNVDLAEGVLWVRTAQAEVDPSTPSTIVAGLDLTEANLAGVLGLHKASFDAAQRALARYRELGDESGAAKAQRQVGRGLVFLGRVAEGEEQLREALATFRACGDRALTGATLDNLGIARNASGDVAGARSLFAEALAIFKALGADRLSVAIANNLAESEFHAGNPAEAFRLADDALSVYGPSIVAHQRALLLSNVAAYLVAMGRFDEAHARARDALVLARSLDFAVVITLSMQRLAAVGALRPDATPENAELAARLFGYVDARIAALEMQREFTEQHEYDASRAALHQRLADHAVTALMADGAAWTEDRAVTEAL